MNLNELLDETARRCPARTALIFLEGDQEKTVSFGQLRELALKAASGFRSKGIGRSDKVAIVHRNGLGFLTAYLGLARLGAAAVPVNFMVQKEEELRFLLGHSEAKAVVTQREFLKGILAAKRSLPALATVWITDDGAAEAPAEDFWALVGAQRPIQDAAVVSSQDVASILYTSGTTGTPKGVMLTHANLVSNCDASIEAMGLTERDAFVCILPMFHTFAWTTCALIPLRLGIKSVVADRVAPPLPWLKLMGRHGVTTFAAVPQVYAALARQARGLRGLVARYWFFRNVRLCVSGAAPLAQSTAQEFQRAFGIQILEGYGLTETSPVATINRPKRVRPASVGQPIRGVEIRVVDDADRPLDPGQEGEILIRGPNVMKGYFKDPEATRETFAPDGWLRTGDIGVLDKDGYLYIRDRKKDMIIVKGLKVFSAQVEAVLSSHPDVEEAAVIGLPDDTGDEMIKAFVTLKEGATVDKAGLMKFCREKLDPYKRPRDLEIVKDLPKNALQKVLKRVLRKAELDKRKEASA